MISRPHGFVKLCASNNGILTAKTNITIMYKIWIIMGVFPMTNAQIRTALRHSTVLGRYDASSKYVPSTYEVIKHSKYVTITSPKQNVETHPGASTFHVSSLIN